MSIYLDGIRLAQSKKRKGLKEIARVRREHNRKKQHKMR